MQKAFTQGSTTTTTNYLYDGNNAEVDVNQNGNVLARYAATQNLDEPLAELRSSTTSYYSQDGLGSITSLTTSAGALGNSYTYDSFGDVNASSGSIANRFQYTGREFDSETGLYFYRARYYDPTGGRFTAEDPIGFGGGMNFYRYVFNNSILLVDSTGLAPGSTGGTGPVEFQIGVLQALFPGSSLEGGAGGVSLLLPMPCDEAKKLLESLPDYYTGHFWDNSPNGMLTWNFFLFWDPLLHSGGSEWRNMWGFHFRMKYEQKCDKTCTLDEFHIDKHNPMFDPGGHFFHDLLHLPE